MLLLYIVGLIALVVVGFWFGRSRAAAAESVERLHSRPAYHGVFVAVCVLAPMLVLCLVGYPIADWIVDTQALHTYDPGIASTDMKRGAILREIAAVANG